MAFEPCKNCGVKIDCSCSYQIASDGTSCCDYCVDAYNFSLQNKIVQSKKQNKKDEQHNNSISDGISESPIDEQP